MEPIEERGRATIHDVARLAGVSTASVSRALSGRRPVTPDVQEKVSKAVARLGYQPDSVAQSLRRQETRTVGLVIADITNPFFPALVKAVEEALLEGGYGLLLVDAADDTQREGAGVRQLLARRVDALFITPSHRVKSRDIVAEASRQVTTVQLDRYASKEAHYVGMDHDRAVGDVLEHLVEVGKTHPAFIGSDPSMSTTWERQRAYVRRSADVDSSAPDRVLMGSFTFEWGRAAAAEILDRWPEIDSLICANDLIALGAIEEINARGLSAPSDVAVVGFDDTMLATLKEPSVTSVRQPLEEMARQAVALIPARISSIADKPVKRLLESTVMMRHSTLPAA